MTSMPRAGTETGSVAALGCWTVSEGERDAAAGGGDFMVVGMTPTPTPMQAHPSARPIPPEAQEAAALSDLTRDAWRIIARRVRSSSCRDGWRYTVPDRELAELRASIAAGWLLVAQRREADGLVLLARRRA